MPDYAAFLDAKAQLGGNHGFDPVWLPDAMFPFQRDLTEWSLRKGRAADFADCGLGKTLIQLAWAENIVRRTGGNVLVLAPLAVSPQTVREGEKFGIEVNRSRDGNPKPGITVTNYERLHLFDPVDFVGAVCDESSILKSFDGKRRQEITIFMRKLKHRLACTATAAPNDYVELGTTSEALGYLGHMDMLGRFFINCQGNSSHRVMRGARWHKYSDSQSRTWRFKGHAEEPFWKWVCSWARALRKPSDLGYDDGRFILPELTETQHVVSSEKLPEGYLFAMPAVGLKEQRAERRRTIQERCEKAAELVDHDRPAIIWCHLNDEGDMLERLVPDAVQVAGKDSDDAKGEKLSGFAAGDFRVLITKPKIGAWGLNFQHCAHVVCFPSHSFEQYYQAVRRCWRFGQERPVQVDMVTTEGELEVLKNLQRKAKAADRMFTRLVEHMNNSMRISRTGFERTEEVPAWL